MSWRNPSYAHLHAARDAGVGGLSLGSGSADSDFPLANLIDDRHSVQMKFTAAATTHELDLNRGAAGLTAISRLSILNHNLDGKRIKLDAGTDGATFGTPLLASTLISGTAAIDTAVTSTTLRYLRLTFPTTSVQPMLGQLIYTATVTLTQGPDPEQWIDQPVSDVLQFDDGDSLQVRPVRRFVEYRYPVAGRTAADLTKLEALISAVSTYRPFLLDSAYAEDDGGWTKVMKLTRDPSESNASRAPAVQSRRRDITLSMLEHIR